MGEDSTEKKLGDAMWGAIRSIGNAFITPLSGFVGLFLITEWSLGKVIPFDKNGSLEASIICAYCLIGIMAVIVLVFCFMAIFCIENLIYDKEARLRDKGKPPFGVKPESNKPNKPNKPVKSGEQPNVTPNNE